MVEAHVLEPWKLVLLAGVAAALWLYRKRVAARWAQRLSTGGLALKFRPLSVLAAAQMEGARKGRKAATWVAAAAVLLVLALAGSGGPGAPVHLAAVALLVVSGVTVWEMAPGRPAAPPGLPGLLLTPPASMAPLRIGMSGAPTQSEMPQLSLLMQGGCNPEDRREYAPGDEARSIDWRASARAGKLVVKLSPADSESRLWLLVDDSASTRAGVAREKRSLMMTLCALVARAASQEDTRLGLALFAGGLEAVVPPQAGKRHADRAVAFLELWEPKTRTTDIPGALAALGRRLEGSNAVFLVSDFAEPLPPAFEGVVRGLQGRGQRVVAVRVSDPLDEEMPDLGAARVENPETGEAWLVNTSDPLLRAAYRKAAAEVQASIRRRMAGLGVPLIEMRTTDTPRSLLERTARLRHEIRAAAAS